jgi:hypothetical protein
MAVNVDELRRELQELIAALDRRVPRVERAGEASIARDAAMLRERAVKRLTELDHDAGIRRAAHDNTARSKRVLEPR